MLSFFVCPMSPTEFPSHHVSYDSIFKTGDVGKDYLLYIITSHGGVAATARSNRGPSLKPPPSSKPDPFKLSTPLSYGCMYKFELVENEGLEGIP